MTIIIFLTELAGATILLLYAVRMVRTGIERAFGASFQRAVMARGKPGDSMAWVVERYVKAKDVVGSRYNCSMCHTPQASNVRTPRNGFVRVEVK